MLSFYDTQQTALRLERQGISGMDMQRIRMATPKMNELERQQVADELCIMDRAAGRLDEDFINSAIGMDIW